MGKKVVRRAKAPARRGQIVRSAGAERGASCLVIARGGLKSLSDMARFTNAAACDLMFGRIRPETAKAAYGMIAATQRSVDLQLKAASTPSQRAVVMASLTA